jgi:hypothetical protein
MKMLKVTIILFMIFSVSGLFAAGETTKSGTAAAQFLKIGVGARAQAMGGSAAALSGDVFSLYWNPAGIADIHRVSWVGTHTRWFADITHQFTGLVLPVGLNSTLGVSATYLTMNEEEITTIESPGGTGLFWDASDIAGGISFATQLTDRFSIGITGKYVYQKVFNETASTLALDVGTLLKTGFKGLMIGMSFTNFGGDLQLAGRDLIRAYDPNPANSRNDDVDVRLHTEPWPLPVNFRVGLAMNLVGKSGESFLANDHHAVLLAIDANHPNDAAENVRFGLEYRLNRLLALRAGYKFNEDLVKFTFGGGLQVPLRQSLVTVDFATASYGELDYVNFLDLGFLF